MLRPTLLWLLLPVCACALVGQDELPKLDTPAALQAFLFPKGDEGSVDALNPVFGLEQAGAMVTLAAKLGPPYALEVARTLPDPEFRDSYRRLAQYLDLFGPCQKQQSGTAEGWWSGYPDPPDAGYCGEATKLVLAAALWNQVHYCQRLVTGADKPRIPVEASPPYRLDEAPVKTLWIKAGPLYALADAAIAHKFQDVLRNCEGDIVRPACLAAAGELEKEKPNRELAALALAKIMVRRFEETHLHHLEQLQPAR